MERPSNQPDKSPVTQNDQLDAGPLNGAQTKGGADNKRDLQQGSEAETLGTSRGH